MKVNKERNSDLIIDGFGSAHGGLFYNMKINGHGTVTGDIDCIQFTCNGIAKIKGNLKAKNAKVSGVATILGNVEADEIKILGKTDLIGNLEAEEIKIEGDVAANGNCEAEHFVNKGRFKFEGQLNADMIDITFYGHCQANEMYGKNILVKRGHKNIHFLNQILDTFRSRLSIDTIEGNDIYLEYTHAKEVRGTNVTIGPECEIDYVEYEDTYTEAENTKVNKSNKI